MTVQNLITTRNSSVLRNTSDTIYTVPATIGGGNVTETFIIDLLLTNLLPTGDDVFVDITVANPTPRFLAKNLKVEGTNEVTDLDIWNNNEKTYAEPVRVSFKVAGLTIGDVVEITATTVADHNIPIVSYYAGIHISNDL